jgi:D-alanine--poly(phosphoribitol) ligase subunit 1
MNETYVIKKLSKISKKFPRNIALRYSSEEFTYREFYNMILNLSDMISQKNNSLIAIIASKEVLSYVSIFGVLMSGNTYVPISSKHPKNRIIKIINKSKADSIICNSKELNFYKKKFPKKYFYTEKDLSIKNNFLKKNIKSHNKLAYIIFTSGSTGKPKGVCISRRSLDHYVKWINSNFKIKNGYNCSQFPEINFDLSVTDIFGTLCSGGTLVPVATNYDKIFPGRFIKNNKINFLVCVPSLIDVIDNAHDLTKNNLKSLKTIFFCGETLFKSQVESILNVKKNLRIINAYGPTETTVSCTHKEVYLKDLNNNKIQSISIGKPIPGMKIKLLEKKKFSKKKGEALIYGRQLADGYLDKNDNKNKFYFSKTGNSFLKPETIFLYTEMKCISKIELIIK